MTDTIERPERLLDDAALLIELEPVVARLYDRHAGMAQEWFPHDFIPSGSGATSTRSRGPRSSRG